jgi:hypothetical protein
MSFMAIFVIAAQRSLKRNCKKESHMQMADKRKKPEEEEQLKTPWLKAKKIQSYQRQEQDLASRGSGGRLQPNSGRSPMRHRDLINWDFLIEARTTDLDTKTINANELQQLTKNAFFHKQLPAMCIEFTKYNEEWILIRQNDFEWYEAQLKILQDRINDLVDQNAR